MVLCLQEAGRLPTGGALCGEVPQNGQAREATAYAADAAPHEVLLSCPDIAALTQPSSAKPGHAPSLLIRLSKPAFADLAKETALQAGKCQRWGSVRDACATNTSTEQGENNAYSGGVRSTGPLQGTAACMSGHCYHTRTTASVTDKNK